MRLRTAALAACVLAVLGFWGITGTAQGTVAVNPTQVVFTASADHNTVDLNGAALVAGYTLNAYLASAPTGAIVATQALGKPTPDASSNITVALSSAFLAGLTAETKYVAMVAATGPDGSGVSAASNPFGLVVAPKAAGAPVIK